VKLVYLPSLIMVVAMVCGPSMLPQSKGSEQPMQLVSSQGLCTEQVSVEAAFQSEGLLPTSHTGDAGASALVLFGLEEETDDDDFVSSGHKPGTLRHDRERSLRAPGMHTSHIVDVTRRPPRARFA
jgi:hypothetical protein